jgi:hypothetical protein
MCSGSQRCTIAPSANNSFKEVFPHLSASRSTNVANRYPNATFATPSPLNNEFLKLYEEEMELINSADKTKPSESSSAETSTAVSESTTMIVVHVVNKAPQRKEIIQGKWMPVVMQSDGNTQLSLTEAESSCVSASSEHNAAKKNGRCPPTRSEKTPTKSRVDTCAKNRKSRAASKRTLDFVDGIDHGSQKMRPREVNEEVMDWQECIGYLLQEQPEDRMDCELDLSTELPLDLEMSDVSVTGVEFSSPEGSPDLDELMVGWESPSSFEISG